MWIYLSEAPGRTGVRLKRQSKSMLSPFGKMLLQLEDIKAEMTPAL